MSKSIIESNERRDISGFYYDHQKRNPLYRVTLHANSKPPVNKYDPWKSWNETSGVDSSFIYYNETNFDVDSANDEVVKGTTTTKNTKYGAMPLCTSIVNEDFNISIANNWSEFIGSQSVQELWNNTAKQLEPYSAFAGEQLKKIAEISDSFKDSKGEESFSGKIAKTIGGLASMGGNFLEKSSDVLGRSLVVQGTRFKYYGGTYGYRKASDKKTLPLRQRASLRHPAYRHCAGRSFPLTCFDGTLFRYPFGRRRKHLCRCR